MRRGMMAMKWLKAASIMSIVIIATLIFANVCYALSTSAVIHLTVRVVRPLSLDLEDEMVYQNVMKPEAEAFSELKDGGVLVDRLRKGNNTIWLFTKTK
jgi:hypothetical protein